MNQPLFNQGGAMPDRIVLLNGQPHLFFSGTAYLCMNHNEAFTQLIQEGMRLYGTNYGSSRSGNFQIPVYEQAEAAMAERFQSETTLTLSSGFMAAQLVIRQYEGAGAFIYAPDSHPALLRTNKDYTTGSYEEWAGNLPEKVATHSSGELVILCNSLDPLKARKHDFSWVDALPDNKSITLIVDDSHGLGITGKNGEGIYASLKNKPGVELVVVSSLGKAMGLPGGVIIAEKEKISQFRKSPYFTAASPMAPAYLYAYLHAAGLYKSEREQLLQNILQFHSNLPKNGGFVVAEKYPVTYCNNYELAAFLLNRQILISSFAYPTPSDNTITRIIINSHHTAEDIQELIHALQSFNSS